MIEPQPIAAPEPLHLAYIPGQSDQLVLSFAGVGIGTETVPRGEFPKLASCDGENHVLLIADSSRSWMNADGLVEAIDAAVQRLCDKIAPSRIAAIGNSMGGSCALIYAGLARVDAVMAFVPQYSVCRSVMRRGNRWRHYTDQIGTWRFPAVPDLSGSGKDIAILDGGNHQELLHAERFVQGASLRHFIFPKLNHQLAAQLKERGQLQDLVTAFLRGEGEQSEALMRAAGGFRTAEFLAHRDRKAQKRAHRLARGAVAPVLQAVEP